LVVGRNMLMLLVILQLGSGIESEGTNSCGLRFLFVLV
jgi:hypothetical protein